MKRFPFGPLAVLLAVLAAAAGCMPEIPVQAGGAGSSPVVLPAGPPAGAVTPGALNTISRVETSMRLTVTAAALAQPVPAGNGLFRVGTLEVSSPEMPEQTLDVLMDRPNSEWAQLPLRTDDINFDGLPDLVVTQPVGARWGRLHTWVYDGSARRFVTNTLTSELGQLRVGEYHLDPATKTMRVVNAVGMTPFEAIYQTSGGYLMPAFPPAGPADAGGCPAKAPGMLLLREEEHGYCLLYPEGTEAYRPTADEVIVGEPGSQGHGPQAFIRVEALGERTAEQVADELLAPLAQLTPEPGHEGALRVRRSRGTLAGEPAVILDGVPGQDLRRMVLVGHRGRLYELTFVPADRSDEGFAAMERLFAAVTSSLRFLER